jgi:oligosaccharyltransferase complex subunit alpha (ribophorin I)
LLKQDLFLILKSRLNLTLKGNGLQGLLNIRGQRWYTLNFAKSSISKLSIVIALTDSVIPIPKKISQFDSPKYVFDRSILLQTPYPTKSANAFIHVSTKDIEYTGLSGLVSKRSGGLNVGPFKDVNAKDSRNLHIHYSTEISNLVHKQSSVQAWISHWSNIVSFEMFHDMVNQGPVLKTPFSRLDQMFSKGTGRSTSALQSLPIIVPSTATNIFYRDSVGNVSTSTVNGRSDLLLLQLFPRYPVYGGWKYSWNHGYQVPLAQFVQKHPSKANYFVCQFPFGGGVLNATSLEHHFKVVLPEGAKDIQVDTNGVVPERVHQSLEYSYFDSMGRPAIEIIAKNVVDEHYGPVTISYELSPSVLYLKPVVVSLAIFLLFLGIMIWQRLDFSIHKVKIFNVVDSVRMKVKKRNFNQLVLMTNSELLFRPWFMKLLY